MNKRKNNKKPAFNEDEFDRKVAQRICNIHINIKRKIIVKTYNKWYNDNVEHLKRLHDLSCLDSEFDVFCSYVFNNSEILEKIELRNNYFLASKNHY